MSKYRKASRKLSDMDSRSRLMSIIQKSNQEALRRNKARQNKVFEQTRCHTQPDGPQQFKDTLYHKNIGKFRDTFNARDTNMLPFLSTLRQIKHYRKQEGMGVTSVQPFDAAYHDTMNQKIKKNTNDYKANAFRLSKVNYRWNKASGESIRQCCEFECSLRLNKNTRDPESSSFDNTLRPIRYKTVEEKTYKTSELICQRQKKIFSVARI